LVKDAADIRKRFLEVGDYCGVVVDVLVGVLRFLEGSNQRNFPANILLDIIVNAAYFSVRCCFI
jgi:hypothetical protein